MVADTDNNRVQIFDETGKYITQFGSKGNRLLVNFLLLQDQEMVSLMAHVMLLSQQRIKSSLLTDLITESNCLKLMESSFPSLELKEAPMDK